MATETIEAGGLRIGEITPLAQGAALTHTFGFLHHRAAGRYFLTWAESTREGPSRVLFSSSTSMTEGWSEPRDLGEVDGPVGSMQLHSSGGTEVPMLFLSYQALVPPGSRRPMEVLVSEDGGRTWSGPHLMRQDEPGPVGGQIPPMEPAGGPGTEHLLHTFVPAPSHKTDGPQAWALVATDRFIEWSLGLRPWTARTGEAGAVESLWGETIYLGIRHHMPLQAYLAEDGDGTLCAVALRSPTDYAQSDKRPEYPQVQVVRLDLPGITQDKDSDGQPDLEDYLQVHYHSEDLYRLWLQCRVDSRELQKRPFISGVRKALKLSKGIVVQSARPYVRPGQGVPRTLLLMGRGVSKQVSIQDIANNRSSRYYEERGKDRYPEVQGFHLAPGEVNADEIKPGMVLVSPGWGQPTHRFTADLQVPSTTGHLPEKCLFGFWSYNFPGAIVQTMPPDPDSADDVSCRVIVELDEEVVLEDGLTFHMLLPEDSPIPDRTPQVVGFDEDKGTSFRLIALGRVSGIPSSPRHVTRGPVL